MLAETLAIHTAFSHSGSRVLVLSATQDAARRLTESIGGTLNASKLTRGAVVDDFATRIRLANGSEIISLPRIGYGAGILLVILYEAGFIPSELWQAAHCVALDQRRNAWTSLASRARRSAPLSAASPHRYRGPSTRGERRPDGPLSGVTARQKHPPTRVGL